MPPVPTFAIDDATDSRLAEYQNVSDPDLARRRVTAVLGERVTELSHLRLPAFSHVRVQERRHIAASLQPLVF